MDTAGKLYPINTQPGIKRDGTAYTGNYYIDGQWTRFMRGLPRKIGGYVQLISGLPNIVYGTYVVPVVPNYNVYLGDKSSLKYFPIDQFRNVLGPLVDRTPAGFLPNNDNVWKFDLMFDALGSTNVLIAHAAPNLSYIDNTVESPVYYGDITLNTPLVSTGFSVSGGAFVLGTFLLMYGNYGQIIITQQNNPTVELTSARVSSQKIVHGLPTRAGNSAPGGLLWTLNSLIRVTQVGEVAGEPAFSFDNVTDQSSILSSSSVIEYDGRYYWAGIDRFLVYNGTVLELPNDKNLIWFYQGLNYAARQKIWATKVPEFGEIWWHYPRGNSTECNASIMFNVREGTWYDTTFENNPNIGRSSGYFEQVFADPIWTDTSIPSSVWVHEVGYDKNINGALASLPYYWETGDVAWCAVGPTGAWVGADRIIDLERIEPDFWQQSGDITMTVNGRAYYNSPLESSGPYTITTSTLKLDVRQQRRFLTLKFESNVVGGFFELGQTLMLLRIGDTRP